MVQSNPRNNTVVVLLLALFAGGGAGLGISLLGATRREPQAAPADPALGRLELALADVRRRQEELARALDAQSTQPGPLESTRVSSADIEAAVERYLAARPELKRSAGEASESAATGMASQDKQALLEEAIAALSVDDMSFEDYTKLWTKYAKQGLVDDLVAYYEGMAAQHPNDPDWQVAAGGAYLQKLFTVGTGPAAGEWAMKADKAFDKALELDENHWDARFAKASSLSHWPAVFGKQPEAIKHFETLIAQQAQGPQKPIYVQSYLLLGNLYQQNGQLQKAMATWNAGLAMFPGNGELAKQIQLNSGN